MPIFVHIQGKKCPHWGRQVVKKGQNYVHVVIESPYVVKILPQFVPFEFRWRFGSVHNIENIGRASLMVSRQDLINNRPN